MKIKYFSDTDTALIKFQDGTILETMEINEDCSVDLGENVKIISITIEHARELASIKELSFLEVEPSA